MTTLTLLQLNDLHGYLEPHPELVRTESAPADPWHDPLVSVWKIQKAIISVRAADDALQGPKLHVMHTICMHYMVFGQPKYARYGRYQAEDFGAGLKPGAGRDRLRNDPATPQ